MLTIAVLGPSSPERVGGAAGIPPERYRAVAAAVGRLLAERGDELLVVPDRGVAVAAMDAYLEAGGPSLVGLSPSSGVSEGPADASIRANLDRCHLVHADLSWFEQHHVIGRMSDAMVCVGLSSGTISELAWTKWNLGPPVAAIEGTMSGLPPELAVEVSVEPVALPALADWLDARVPRAVGRAHA